MTHEDFCNWLKGYLDMAGADGSTPEVTPKQLDMIDKHLQLVFKHEEYIIKKQQEQAKNPLSGWRGPEPTYCSPLSSDSELLANC